MKKSKFDLSHNLLTTGDFGYLYPILVEDCLPGDTWNVRSELFIKAIPLLAPIIDTCNVRVDYFFVPNRLIWTGWEKFITGGADGTNTQKAPWFKFAPALSPDFNPDIADIGGNDALAVVDKLYQLSFTQDFLAGYSLETLPLSALPIAAYQRIWHDWYLPQNVNWTNGLDLDAFVGWEDDDVNVDGHLTDSGLLKLRSWFKLMQRCYNRDRLTNANPLPQRGPEVGFDIPPADMVGSATGPNGYYVKRGTSTPIEAGRRASFANNGNLTAEMGTNVDVAVHTHSQNFQRGELGSLTINELRRLNALQRWFEKNARYGGRYIEQIMSHFGVRTPDYRLDRSEYLGGTVNPIQVSETYQTASGASTQETADVLGQYAGHLTSFGVNGMRKYTCDEHGWIIGLMSIVPRMAYAQGIQKRFSRFDRLDYAFPEFAQLGEEAIYKKEVYVETEHEWDSDAVFGYTPRYSDYRSRQDRFDSQFLRTFPWWHLGQIFDTKNPAILNVDFLYPRTQDGDSQFDRIFAYTPQNPDGPQGQANFERFHFLCNVRHHISVKRCLPKYVTPSL